MYEWFEAIAGPNYAPALMWTLLALLGFFVLLLAVRLFRRMRSGTYIEGGRNRRARLAILDATAVDDMRRLVLVRRDDVEHLILIGGPSDVVVEQNIKQQAPVEPRIEPERASIATPAPAQRPVRADPAPSAPPSPSAPVRSEPPHIRNKAPQPQRAAQPVAAPEPARNVEPPRSATANQHSTPSPAPAARKEEPVTAPVAVPASTGAPAVQSQATGPGSALSNETSADDTANHSIDLDDALLSELESSLEPREAPANEARRTQDPSAEISLDEEMSRLLGDLSDENRR